MAETEQLIRETGIDALGSVLWGTHFCLFYRTKQDLLNILVPYLKAGLENNEFCMWITSEPLGPKESQNALRKTMPDLDEYLRKGQIEILPYDQWYLQDDDFNQQRMLKKWNDKLTGALTNGYAGMRITGNTTWVDQKLWNGFINYEHQINETIERYRMIVVCTYCLDKCGPAEIVQVVNTHQLALIERAHQWELIKNAERIRAEKRSRQYQAHLKSLASELSLAEEREKHQIATALHDKISQSLVISKIKLEAMRKSGFGLDLDKALEDICDSLGRVIQDTRTLTFDLSNPVLYELGFETAVAEWLTTEIQAKYSISTEFEDDGQDKPLDDNVRVFLFRDVRELLINVVKHSHAKNVKVSIRKTGNAISITVQDDGVGFDPAEVTYSAIKKGEFGLFSIREHLEQSGGQLEIESAPGQGCKVTMTAPLKTDGEKK